jgi:hypothetical protein
MAVCVLPYGKPRGSFVRLAEIPLDTLLWPLQDRPGEGTVADLSDEDHLIVYASQSAFTAVQRGVNCRVSILLVEPPAIKPTHYRILQFSGWRFHRVLTHSSWLLERLQNSLFVPHGGTFLPSVSVPSTPKTARISLVASKKRTTVGHKLRHRVAADLSARAPDLKLFGYGYNPVEDKTVAHAPFHYSLVIENSRCAGYFTEKLIDSLLCQCLPVYWGAPDIAHFFDTRGMICCSSAAELIEAAEKCTAHDYEERRPFIEQNCFRALDFVDVHVNSARVLEFDSRYGVKGLASTFRP